MGRVCMGRVGYVPSLLCAEFVMGRVCHVPSLLCAELSLNPQPDGIMWDFLRHTGISGLANFLYGII